jgi:serine/threonine protein kinase
MHLDLKARNVLLKSGGGRGSRRDFIAKVADFGLSIKMDAEETHVSQVYQVRAVVGQEGGGRREAGGGKAGLPALPAFLRVCVWGGGGQGRERCCCVGRCILGAGADGCGMPSTLLTCLLTCLAAAPLVPHTHTPSLPPSHAPSHLATQGTITHMAPEVMLAGR